MFRQPRENNFPQPSLAIDLHQFSVKEAKQEISQAFQDAEEKQALDLTIVTGIGKHLNSNGTRGVLFRSLPKWLKRPSFKHFIKDIKQDMGAYEITFSWRDNDGYQQYIDQLNDDIRALFKDRDLNIIVKELEQKAKNGNVESQKLIGSWYVNGIGVNQDIKKGLSWLIQAASTSSEVQIQLGAIYSSNNFPIKDYEESLKWFLKAAESDHPEALFYLGKMYWLGRGVIKHDIKAVNYLKHAAHLGHDAAAHSLADIYFNGVGKISRDLKLAEKFYIIAASAGRIEAQLMLGRQYFYGWGVAQDDKRAFDWFLKAALKENAIALYYVGYCHETGRGVEQDIVKAIEWYEKSALRGDLDAQFNLAYSYLIGSIYKRDIKKALNLLNPLADKKHVNSLFVLGDFLLSKSSYQDIARAKYLIKAAAEEGQLDAQKLLARLYLSENQEEGKAQALYWFHKASQQDDAEAFYELSLLSIDENTKAFNEAGFDFLKQAVHLGYAKAQVALGMLYSRGSTFLAKNLNQAFYYFQQAAFQDDVDALTGLGFCYLNGMGVQVNLSLAKSYFEKAAKKGCNTARINLIYLLRSSSNSISLSKEAIYWLELASNDGERACQYTLGRFCLSKKNSFGAGVYWLYQAALQEHPDALNFFYQTNLASHTPAILQILSVEYKQRQNKETFPLLTLWQKSTLPLANVCSEVNITSLSHSQDSPSAKNSNIGKEQSHAVQQPIFSPATYSICSNKNSFWQPIMRTTGFVTTVGVVALAAGFLAKKIYK